MTDISRRTLLAGSAVAGASLTLKTEDAAQAAAPQAGKQVTGFYRYKVGDIEVTVVTDGANRMKLPDDFVSNAKKDDVNAALAAAYMEKDVFVGPYNPVVVNTGSKLVLIDTGVGEAGFKASNGASGQLMNNLKAAGIDPKSIDVVLISHFHGDHVNGLLMADNSLAFPNAEVMVPEAEYKYWMDDGEMSRATNPRIQGLFKNNRRVFSGDVVKRMTQYAWGKDVLPGIQAVGTPGHSPGHTSHILSSGGSTLYVQADVTHVPYLFARNPGWHAFYDHDPQMAEVTRRKVYDMLAADKIRVQGFHYPFPSNAYVEKAGNGYREIPVAWNPSI
jgi:glyoxylase-like metal-dependent hydrolase (beta-lactamase superfamily II)